MLCGSYLQNTILITQTELDSHIPVCGSTVILSNHYSQLTALRAVNKTLSAVDLAKLMDISAQPLEATLSNTGQDYDRNKRASIFDGKVLVIQFSGVALNYDHNYIRNGMNLISEVLFLCLHGRLSNETAIHTQTICA